MKKVIISLGVLVALVLGAFLLEKWTRVSEFNAACTYCGAKTKVRIDRSGETLSPILAEGRMPWVKHEHRWVPDGFMVSSSLFLLDKHDAHGPRFFVFFLELEAFWELVRSPGETPEKLQAFYLKLVEVSLARATSNHALKEMLD